MDRKTYDTALKILLALGECVDKAIDQLEELKAGEETVVKVEIIKGDKE